MNLDRQETASWVLIYPLCPFYLVGFFIHYGTDLNVKKEKLFELFSSQIAQKICRTFCSRINIFILLRTSLKFEKYDSLNGSKNVHRHMPVPWWGKGRLFLGFIPFTWT